MGLSTAPQLRFLKRQGKGAKPAAAVEQHQTSAQPAAGVQKAVRVAHTVHEHDGGL